MGLRFLWQAPPVHETFRSSAHVPVTRRSSKPSRHARLADRPVVLVVDDDASVREALRLVLDEDYAVVDAAHGRTALALVRARRQSSNVWGTVSATQSSTDHKSLATASHRMAHADSQKIQNVGKIIAHPAACPRD